MQTSTYMSVKWEDTYKPSSDLRWTKDRFSIFNMLLKLKSLENNESS